MDIIMTTENLETLTICKEDIKSAIEEKGVTPSGGLTTFADAIRSIKRNEGPGEDFVIQYVNGMILQHSSFRTAPKLINTSYTTNMEGMFFGCKNLTTVPLIDTSSVTNVQYMFSGCTKLTHVGGLTNFGKNPNLLYPAAMFQDCNNLTHDSIMNIINNLYDRATAGYSVVTLPLGSTNLGRISNDEIAIATNKGWTVVAS